MDPALFNLGLYPTGHKYSQKNVSLPCQNIYCTLLEKNSPVVIFWIRQTLATLPLERITNIHKGKQEKFEEVWNLFYLFVKDAKLIGEEN